MLETTYATDSAAEETHWWFVGRRRLFARELEGAGVPRNARVLDIGTGVGTNLRMLRNLEFSAVEGLDPSKEAVHWCASKGLGPVHLGSVNDIPFENGAFDVVLATDVIEHVDDDGRAMEEVARVLAPNGIALITVPAFPSLWGLEDDVSLHRRRYRMRALRQLVYESGLAVRRAYHFNYLLFIPIWGARRMMRLTNPRLQSETQIRTPLLDRLLSVVFAVDVLTAPRLRLPFGVSILILAAKPLQ